MSTGAGMLWALVSGPAALILEDAVMVIDLDESARAQPEAAAAALRHRRRRLISAVGLVAVGGVLGGSATYQWGGHRSDRAEGSAVAVLAVPGAFAWTGDSSTHSGPAGKSETFVKMAGQVSVVNVGPERIYLRKLTVDQAAGFTLYGNDVERWIEPDKASVVEVFAEMECPENSPTAIKLSLSVETVDGKRLDLPPSVDPEGYLRPSGLEGGCSENSTY